MTLSTIARKLIRQFDQNEVRMGEIKKCAKELKKNHALALELWSSELYFPRLLAVLIMDKKQITQELMDQLVADLVVHEMDQRNRILEWLLANQLMKSRPGVAMLESWQHAAAPGLRRLFWYHQARLRWNGQTSPDNTSELLESIEQELERVEPEVQWAMNFAAAWIGIHQPEHRTRCIELGLRVGLYKDEPVPYNCTPNYLPEFIRIESDKLTA